MSRAQIIDVSDWPEDEEFATYPEGARSKRAYFAPEHVPDFIRSGRRYLLKRSDKRYPEQFWGEVIAAFLGDMLAVPVPPAYPAVDEKRGTVGALIEWFYEDRAAVFIMGGNFLQQMIPDFDRKRGTQHNFRSIQALCKAFRNSRSLRRDWLAAWTDALTFDALIGNTDRHQDNWGFLFIRQGDDAELRLAPWYDNGTSLGHERWPQHTANWKEVDYERYLRRGAHHLRWTVDSPERCGFLELPGLLVKHAPGSKARMLQLLQRLDLLRLEAFLAQCRSLPHPVPLTEWRSAFIVRLIKLRRDLLLQTLS